MNFHNAKFVNCPYDPNHYVKENRLKWHMAKCPSRHHDREEFHCMYYYEHMFYSRDELEKHEKETCPVMIEKMKIVRS